MWWWLSRLVSGGGGGGGGGGGVVEGSRESWLADLPLWLLPEPPECCCGSSQVFSSLHRTMATAAQRPARMTSSRQVSSSSVADLPPLVCSRVVGVVVVVAMADLTGRLLNSALHRAPRQQQNSTLPGSP